MRAITLSVETTRGRAGVYAYLSDVTAMVEWTGVVQSCELVSGAAGVVGATYRQSLDIGGSPYDGTLEVTAADPDRRLVTVAKVGPIKLTTTFELSDAAGPSGAGGTKVVMLIDPGVAGLALAPMFRTGGEIDIETLRQRLDRPD